MLEAPQFNPRREVKSRRPRPSPPQVRRIDMLDSPVRRFKEPTTRVCIPESEYNLRSKQRLLFRLYLYIMWCTVLRPGNQPCRVPPNQPPSGPAMNFDEPPTH